MKLTTMTRVSVDGVVQGNGARDANPSGDAMTRPCPRFPRLSRVGKQGVDGSSPSEGCVLPCSDGAPEQFEFSWNIWALLPHHELPRSIADRGITSPEKALTTSPNETASRVGRKLLRLDRACPRSRARPAPSWNHFQRGCRDG